MIISAIRFLSENSTDWQAWRLTTGTGIYRDFICIKGDETTLSSVEAALEYAISGSTSFGISEVSLQISDDGGDNWMVHRKGEQVNYLKNGASHAKGENQEFLDAILDIEGSEFQGDSAELSFEKFKVAERDGEFIGLTDEDGEDPRIHMKQIVGDQISILANECAKASGLVELSHPKKLAQLTRLVEPLLGRYKELRANAKEIDNELKAIKKTNIRSLEGIADEIDIIDKIKELGQPLLDPSSSLKLKRGQLKAVDLKINNLIDELNLDARLKNTRVKDWRKPLESLCRMEAYGKLVHASQGARNYCHQKIEPSYKSYISAIRKSLDKDKAVSSELESCLASLNLYCGIKGNEPTEIKSKNWFEKFKTKQVDETADVLNQSQIDTIRMAIEYVLGRLNDMQRRALEAGGKHDSVQKRVDDSHEELVKTYGNLREHWYKVANHYGLPDDMNLNSIIKHVCAQSELVSLNAQRDLLISEVDSHRQNLKALKEEIQIWRKHTGSQKQTELSTESIILTDARDIINLRQVRNTQYRNWQKNAAEAKACAYVRGMIKKKKIALDASWEKAFDSVDLLPAPIGAKYWDDIIKRSGLISALALIHSTSGRSNVRRVFERTQSNCPATIYTCLAGMSAGSRQRFVQSLKNAAENTVGNLQILLTSDETLFSMLKDQGIGYAKQVKVAPKKVAAQPVVADKAPARPSASQLNERAQAALDILTGGK